MHALFKEPFYEVYQEYLLIFCLSLQFFVTYDLYIAAFAGAGIALLALVSKNVHPDWWVYGVCLGLGSEYDLILQLQLG